MPGTETYGALDGQAIDWLLASDEPGIRLQARRDLLDEVVELRADEVCAGLLTPNALRVLKIAGA